ncbi:MAG: undecaprenyldiphospho-muramoylpentapeptide beta-N-acetylglucosaminyltransferase [Ignavibacteria bacterium]|nr:undecaprenyldiphospho-muramoylpentapeptide beta-N-acetylglucosaminyltransferase [Ignavibacteria bacterium]
MSRRGNRNRVLFAGGGTGGHLFPAIAVAEQIKEMNKETEILFVGTRSKIEGKVVPELGYNFKSIWIKGFSRRFEWENLLFPLKLFVSLIQSLIINLKFLPDVAIGSGGYVSGPAIFGSSIIGAKIILLEQNSYPGITTKLLERFANEVHISFNDSRDYLKRQDIVHFTGNPVRKYLGTEKKSTALEKFELNLEYKTLLILGGSLGAASINKAIKENVDELLNNDVQIIWQTGKNYIDEYRNLTSSKVKVFEFIDDMNAAYSACDLLLARAGATTIAEILVLGIPSVLVPSPNVAEDHQYYNAKSLTDKNAAVLIKDDELIAILFERVMAIINSDEKLKELKQNAFKLAKPESAKRIAKNVLRYIEMK